MTIKDRLAALRREIEQSAIKVDRDPATIQLVAVSKNCSIEMIMQAYATGQRHFGENRIAELISKKNLLPEDIIWHFIGRIQSNKIAKIVNHSELIHSVASVEHAQKIAEQGLKQSRMVPMLLEVNTSDETSKDGLSCDLWRQNFEQLINLDKINIQGLMTMAPLTHDENKIRYCFKQLRIFRDQLQEQFNVIMPILSMGMSQDYKIAIEEGTTLLRLGNAIFNP